MKKIISLLCIICFLTAFVASLTLVAGASDASPVRVANDFRSEDWTFSDGVEADFRQRAGERISLSLLSENSDFYLNVSDRSAWDFKIDLGLDAAALTEDTAFDMSLYDGDSPVAALKVLPHGETYDVKLTVGGSVLEFTGVYYGDFNDGMLRVQIRFSYDSLLDLNTQTYSDGWNFVAGSDKFYNSQANIFSSKAQYSEPMSDITAAMEEKRLDGLTFRMNVTGYIADHALDVIQLNDEYYYDYAVFAAPRLVDDTSLYYDRIAIMWDLPALSEYQRTSFRVERFVGDVREKITNFSDAYASSLSDTRLKQNTAYSYKVSAYRELDTVLNSIACESLAFKYETFTTTTLKGDFGIFIRFSVVFVVVMALIIVLYVFRYDIGKFFNKRKK